MTHSWNNNSSNSSHGFLYFNNSSSFQESNSSDTSDFLSFSTESSPANSPQNKNFCPTNFSSPHNKNFYGKMQKNRMGRHNYFIPHKSNGGKQWRRNAGLTSPNEQNICFSNGAQNVQHRRPYRNNQQNYHKNRQDLNQSAFYDSTCLEDPWQELEKKFQKEKHSNDNFDSNISANLSTEESEEASSDESSSSNDSEDKSDEMEESFS